MGKRFWYAEKNGLGLNLTLGSVGWKVLRFASKRERDNYVDENEYLHDTGRWICRAIDCRRMYEHLGYGKIIWYTDDSSYPHEIGVQGSM